MTKYSKGEWTNARYDICEIECDGEIFCTVATKDVELIIGVLNENEQLKQQLSDIDGQLVMLDNCDNWDYDRMKYTVRKIAEIIGYNGTINPKR